MSFYIKLSFGFCVSVSVFANLHGETFDKLRHAWSHINLATAAEREGRGLKNLTWLTK